MLSHGRPTVKATALSILLLAAFAQLCTGQQQPAGGQGPMPPQGGNGTQPAGPLGGPAGVNGTGLRTCPCATPGANSTMPGNGTLPLARNGSFPGNGTQPGNNTVPLGNGTLPDGGCWCLDDVPAARVTCPAGFGISTQVTLAGNALQVVRSGCPPYSAINATAANNTREDKQPVCQAGIPFKVMSPPVINSQVTWVSRTFKNGSVNPMGGVRGIIGLTMTGVALYSDSDPDGNDWMTTEASTLDSCLGAVDPRTGAYHYHSRIPAGCGYNDTTGQHSTIYALMVDGIPLYGALGDNGAVPSDLDECGGHTDASVPFYHYHLPNGTVAPYTVRCLKACTATPLGPPARNTTLACTPAANSLQYNYTALVLPWVVGLSADSSPCRNATTTQPDMRRQDNPNRNNGNSTRPAPRPGKPLALRLTLTGVDYFALITNATKFSGLKKDICAAAVADAARRNVTGVNCTVLSIAPGSIVAQVQLTPDDEANDAAMQTAATAFVQDPSSAFSASFSAEYGVTGYSVQAESGTTTDSSSSVKPFPWTLVVGCAVGGVAAMAGLALAVILVRRRRSSTRVADQQTAATRSSSSSSSSTRDQAGLIIAPHNVNGKPVAEGRMSPSSVLFTRVHSPGSQSKVVPVVMEVV